MPSKSRCKICYQRERRNDPTAKTGEIKSRCANPTNGCVVCNLYVCSGCWQIHVDQVLQQRGVQKEDDFAPCQSVYSDRCGSLVVESFLAINKLSWNAFLRARWERETQLFTYDAEICAISSNPNAIPTLNASPGHLSSGKMIPARSLVPPIYGGDGCWRETSMVVFPLRELIRQGWHILTTLMTADYDSGTDGMTTTEPTVHVSILKQSHPMTRDEIKKMYSGDLYEAYLSGCSMAWENCDLQSPYIASLCNDLEGKPGDFGERDETQKRGPFDKASATAHLDPPQHSKSSSQEIISDQNLFVFQLAGKKYWKTYWKIPIEESSESKEGEEAAIPASISWKQTCFEGFLYPGDILYLPKGICYQCQTQSPSEAKSNGVDSNKSDSTLSFDVTIATNISSGAITESTEKMPPMDQEDTSMPDAPTNNYVADSSTNEQQQQQQQRQEEAKESNVGPLQKRTLIIQKARETSPILLNSQLLSNVDEQEGSTAQPEDENFKAKQCEASVGPAIASQISFQTRVRTSTRREQLFCEELLMKKEYKEMNKRRDNGIRSELRGVARVIATMVRTMTTVDGRMRVCDLCELVKEAFGNQDEDYLVCELSMLALIKREIENGKLAVYRL